MPDASVATLSPAIHAATALTPDGWQADVRIELVGGTVATVTAGVPACPGDTRVGVLLPAVCNLHSHAFQRGMAGLAERRGPAADSFWSWRETMYRFALAVTPDDVEAIAAQLYVEMLEAGFCRVGEFHYLHHDGDGTPYGDVAEMALRIAAAAGATGIGLTLLPVFYAHAGFGGARPAAEQRRFISDPDLFARLVEGGRAAVAGLPGSVVGIAPHSLRAATPAEIAAILPLAQGGPVHIHVAEQVREVEDCIAATGRRPVQHLMDIAPVDGRWCLIHATHMEPDETEALARSGAVAGLCPLTEANLGDGTFDAVRFTAAGGRWGVGSDSHIQVGLADELRQLEYSQRLAHRARNVLAQGGGSTGRALFDTALAGGAQALGTRPAAIAPGAPADLVALDAGSPALAGRAGDALLDAWIFTGAKAVDHVWSAGRPVVIDGRHVDRDRIAARYAHVSTRLAAG